MFSLIKLLKRTITFYVTVIFNIFMRQTLNDDFWALHKNMNCVFPLEFRGKHKKQSSGSFCQKDVFKRILNFTRKTTVLESQQVLFSEIWEIMKNTYFKEHLQTTASKLN